MRIAEAVAPAVNSFVAGQELDGESLLGVLPEGLRPPEVASLAGLVQGYSTPAHEHSLPHPVPAENARFAFLFKLGKAAVKLGDPVTAESSLRLLEERHREPISRRTALLLRRCIARGALELKTSQRLNLNPPRQAKVRVQ